MSHIDGDRDSKLRLRVAPSSRPALNREADDFLVSVVVPLLNEEENVLPMWDELRDVSIGWPFRAEFIFVDDGSRDRTPALLHDVAESDERVTVIQLSRRFGQSAALSAGFRQARGQVVVAMDADMQNNPRDIVHMVQTLDEPPGFDVVSGWRRKRHDGFWMRRLPSMVANRLIARFTWTDIHDFGCTLKAYRREALEDLAIYGEMHRFLPAICQWQGARVTERVVDHRPRLRGKSKYNLKRTVKVLLDLVTVKFLGDYLTKPLYFFGKLGLMCTGLAMVALTVAVCQKFGFLYPHPGGLNLTRNILVDLGMMLLIVALMLIMMGLLSELLVRIYHESQGRAPYRVRSVYRAGRRDMKVPEGTRGASESADAS